MSLALISGCASTPAPVAQTPETPVGPPQKTLDMTVLHLSNRVGAIEPCGCSERPYGGIDREANAVRGIRAERPASLYVDSGNLFAHVQTKKSASWVRSRARALVGMLNQVGLDAYSPGPGDYKHAGLTFLKELEKGAKFRFVTTNVVDAAGKTVFAPYQIVERGGVKFGILAVSTPENLPAGTRVLPPEAAVLKYLPEVKEKSDVVVLLSQLGSEGDEALAVKLPDVRVLVGADPNYSLDNAFPLGRGRTLLVDAAENGFQLGRLDMSLTVPFVKFYSPPNGGNPYEPMEPSDVPGKPGLATYKHELIKLDAERYGTPNDVTKLVAGEKERVRQKALSE